MTQHIPVLPAEVVEHLNLAPGKMVVDGTLGGGGHTRLLAERVGPDGLVIGIDRDAAAVETAKTVLSGLPVRLFNANYSDIPEVLAACSIDAVDGIVLDLGLSSDQLADGQRGFSFQSEGTLDLRFDTASGDPAWKLLARLSERHLADLIYEFGQEKFSRRIARKIVDTREQSPIRTANELADLVRKCVPRSKNHSIDPATRTFQALRIAVNEELKWLSVAMRRLPDCLKPGGRLVVISFHSLEDRIVKNGLRENEQLQVITRRPLVPTPEETQQNPRSRSSKLRVAEKK